MKKMMMVALVSSTLTLSGCSSTRDVEYIRSERIFGCGKLFK